MPVFEVTPQEAMEVYNFSLAEEELQSMIEYLQSQGQPTDHEDSLLAIARKSQIRLQATEQVTIIDSIALPKQQVLSRIRLSEDCGSIMHSKDFFKTSGNDDCTAFLNGLRTPVVYAEPNDAGNLRLKEKTLIGGEYTMEKQLYGFEEAIDDNFNYPFLLMDGVTLYFAAECEESLGGYDIFMTRYDADAGQYLVPENIGMPFNSPANDYLMVIDEMLNLGWFVTDRNQPADSVCIYTFIPTQTRRIYDSNLISAESLASLARITSIRDTWTNQDEVTAAQDRLRKANEKHEVAAVVHDFVFVVNDQRTCYTLSDFRDADARRKAKVWQETLNELNANRNALAGLRDKYAAAKADQRAKLGEQILSYESSIAQLAADKLALEKEIRRLELNQK